MSINILMPALSPTMTEGALQKWFVKEGDEVKSGDVIAEIETDKATMEIEAVDEGVIKDLLFEEGEEDFLDFGIEYNPADYWFNKEKMNTIKAIHDHLEEYEFSGKVLSLASLIRAAEKLNKGKEFQPIRLISMISCVIVYLQLMVFLFSAILTRFRKIHLGIACNIYNCLISLSLNGGSFKFIINHHLIHGWRNLEKSVLIIRSILH